MVGQTEKIKNASINSDLETLRCEHSNNSRKYICCNTLFIYKISDFCGIHKEISTHTARHSYATSVCFANGVSIENVAKMLGHSDISMTKRYARVLDQRILNDMQKVGSLSGTTV